MKQRFVAAGMGILLMTACANDDDAHIDDTIATLEADMAENFSDDDEAVAYLPVESPDFLSHGNPKKIPGAGPGQVQGHFIPQRVSVRTPAWSGGA